MPCRHQRGGPRHGSWGVATAMVGGVPVRPLSPAARAPRRRRHRAIPPGWNPSPGGTWRRRHARRRHRGGGWGGDGATGGGRHALAAPRCGRRVGCQHSRGEGAAAAATAPACCRVDGSARAAARARKGGPLQPRRVCSAGATLTLPLQSPPPRPPPAPPPYGHRRQITAWPPPRQGGGRRQRPPPRSARPRRRRRIAGDGRHRVVPQAAGHEACQHRTHEWPCVPYSRWGGAVWQGGTAKPTNQPGDPSADRTFQPRTSSRTGAAEGTPRPAAGRCTTGAHPGHGGTARTVGDLAPPNQWAHVRAAAGPTTVPLGEACSRCRCCGRPSGHRPGPTPPARVARPLALRHRHRRLRRRRRRRHAPPSSRSPRPKRAR